MASAWGSSSGSAWGDSWGSSDAAAAGSSGKPWRQKWRQELVDLLDADTPIPPVPAKVGKAIQRVLAKAPPDDSSAIRSLRNELSRLSVSYKPIYVDALRQRALEALDDEDVILLLLH